MLNACKCNDNLFYTTHNFMKGLIELCRLTDMSVLIADTNLKNFNPFPQNR